MRMNVPERFAGRLSDTRSIDLGWYFTQSFAFGGKTQELSKVLTIIQLPGPFSQPAAQ